MRSDPNSYFDTTEIKENLAQRTVRGGLLSGAAQTVKSILQLVGLTVVLPRLISPDEFGMIGMVISVIGFVALFRDLGLADATVQREDITHDQVSGLFWVNAGVGVAIAVVTAGLAPVIAWFYGYPELAGITAVLAVTAVFGGLTVQHQAILRRQMRYGALASIEVIALATQIAVAVLMALAGFSYWALVGGRLALAGVVMIGVWVACSWRPARPQRGAEIGELVRFGGNVTGFNLVNYFARNLDDILIGKFRGTTALGLYRKAYEIFRLPLDQINRPVSRVALPALSRLVGEPKRYRSAYLRILEKVSLVTFPVGVYIIMTADVLPAVVLGERWAGAGPLLLAMGLLMFAQPIGSSTGWLFISQNRTKEFLRWGIVGSSMAVLSFVVGLPWGAFGVALAYSISGVLVRTPALLWWVGRKGPVRTVDFYRTTAPFLLASLVSALAVLDFRYLVELEPVPDLLASLVVTAVSFLGALLVLKSGRKALLDFKIIFDEMKKLKEKKK